MLFFLFFVACCYVLFCRTHYYNREIVYFKYATYSDKFSPYGHIDVSLLICQQNFVHNV
jgi:hypothetical protein